MSSQGGQSPNQMANRRKEIFRTVRGSALTGMRGQFAGASGAQLVADAARASAQDEEPQTMRRVRLGPVIEDETDGPATLGSRRYSEPND